MNDEGEGDKNPILMTDAEFLATNILSVYTFLLHSNVRKPPSYDLIVVKIYIIRGGRITTFDHRTVE